MPTAAQLTAAVSVTGASEGQAALMGVSESADHAQSSLNRVGPASREASGGFLAGISSMIGGALDFGAKIGQMTFGIQSLFQGFQGLVGGLFNSDAAMEQTQTAFVQLLGSTQAANKELHDLQQFAAETPFEFPELAHATQQLIAFQFPLKETKPLLTAIGDALSGLGENTPAMLDQVVQVFGQMHAAGKIQTQDLLQLTSVGINGFQILADQMHKPVSTIKDMVSQGLIPADQGIKLLQNGMEKTFGGGMAAQATTFNGLLSTLQDNIGAAWRAFTGPLFDKAKQGLEKIGDLVSSKAFQDFAGSIGKGVATVFSDIANAFGRVAQYFGNFDMTSLVGAFRNLGDAVGSILSPLQHLASNKDAVGFFTTLKNAFSQAFVHAIQDVSNIINALAGDLKQLGSNPAVISFLHSLQQGFQQVGQILGGQVGQNLRQFGQTAQQVGQWFQTSMLPAIQSAMPGFEHLGSVLATTVAPALARIWTVGQQVANQVMPPLIRAFETVAPIVMRVGGFLADNLGKALQFITPFIVQAAQQIGKFATDIATRAQPIIQNIYNTIKSFLDWIKPYWPQIWGVIQNTFKATWDTIKGVIQIAWSIVSGIIKVGLDLLSGNWKQAWDDIKSMFSGIWDGIKSVASGVWGFVSGPIMAGVGNFKKWWGNTWDGIKGKFNDIWNNIKGFASGVWDGIAGAIKGGINNVIGLINNFISGLDNLHISLPGGGSVGFSIPLIPYLAEGGLIARGGMAVVGERGPERVYLPAGAQVVPNSQAFGSQQAAPDNRPIILVMDGRIVGRGVMPHIVAELRNRLGVQF